MFPAAVANNRRILYENRSHYEDCSPSVINIMGACLRLISNKQGGEALQSKTKGKRKEPGIDDGLTCVPFVCHARLQKWMPFGKENSERTCEFASVQKVNYACKHDKELGYANIIF